MKIILSKLNELQTLFAADNTSQVSPTGQIATPPVDATLILEERRGSYSSSPTASRSMEQFLLSQQHLYQNPSLPIRSPDGKKHYNSSPPTHEVNRRMGFGRESYLLNPEPNANFQENQSEGM
ncbi:hypothetical protein HPULCUR_005435 [Helicostylum pulchrum]|uniref:Uncharacterized protein n=1 Tax=Helicostylum pulchrum TaxID=562976 RepID=A0ABP9XZ21_9FUNG